MAYPHPNFITFYGKVIHMGIFWWIPALVPIMGILILLVGPQWPIARWEGAKSDDEIRSNWVKFGVYTMVNLTACFLVALASWTGAVAKTKFPEVWNFCVAEIRHEMEWTTKERHEVQVPDGRDKDGHTRYKTRVYYTTEHHGPYWYRVDQYGNETLIDESEYLRWRSVWANEKQTGMHKGSSTGFDRSIDGPIYTCTWPNTFATIWPETSIRKYVNKIRVSNSVLRYGEATEAQLTRFPRPADKGNASPVLIYGGLNIKGDETLFLQRVNASLGRSHEIHAILVVFGKDESRDVVTDVLTAWQGPNKNELVTFVSLDGQTVRWVEVHSWMDDTTLHATLRDELMGKPFTATRYGELLREYVPKLWHRKHFTPINSYLRVSIHPGWLVLGVVLSIASLVGSYFIIERMWRGHSHYGSSLYLR